MSDDQEMQFADPAWQPRVTRDFSQEQASSSASGTAARPAQQDSGTNDDYARGYRASTAHNAEHASTPGNQRRRPAASGPAPLWYQRLPTWAWWLLGVMVISSIVGSATFEEGSAGSLFGLIFVALLLAAGWLIATRRLRVSLSGESVQTETHTFEVGPLPTIAIRNKAGSIRLHAGQQSQVSITISKRGYLFTRRWDRDIQVWFNQDRTQNTVSARVDNWKLFGRNAVDFDLTVPPRCTLELTTNAGNISVTQIDGQMKLRTDAGSIRATRVSLSGRSQLKTDAGSITLDGALDPAGDYRLSTDLGNVHVTLPSTASFNLEAKTDLGSVTTNLPLAQQQRTKLSGLVGGGPHPRLKVTTDLGSVQVYCK
ncbi:MAG TPA: DUF4097 family beta strand repeat-containing protein [Ktedonobacteraceae bacterium]